MDAEPRRRKHLQRRPPAVGKPNLSESVAGDVVPTLDPADVRANADAHKRDVSLMG